MLSVIDQVRWIDIVEEVCEDAERRFGLQLRIDEAVVEEMAIAAKNGLRGYGADQPNPAKVAGHVSFWIRRLKPVSHREDTVARLYVVNEWIALKVGLAICEEYFENQRKPSFDLPPRVLTDWVISLHVNSHSPHSLAFAFEILTCAR